MSAVFDDLAADDPRHGRNSTYCNHGCRCDACRAANSEYRRAWRRRGGRDLERRVKLERAAALAVLRDRHYAEYREILTAVRAGEVVDS